MQNQDTLKLNDIPFGSWLVGFISLGIAVYFFSMQGMTLNTILFGGVGLLFLLVSRGLTITADRNTRILRLEYWSLYLWRTIREIPFDEIANLRVNSTVSGTGSRRSRSYRVEIIRKDGKVVPFRSVYSSGSFSKQKIVDQLRAFMGLEATYDESLQGFYRAAQKATAEMAEQQQEALTGPNEQERITNGVRWRLQSMSLGASAPVTRWYSPDFKMRDGFLFLAQKIPGQAAAGGLMATLGKALFQQSISLYGFSEGDVPKMSQAETLTSIPPLLDSHFTAFTNAEAESRQILNPWMQRPLADWGQRYPLKQFKTGVSQLVVLFSPKGVYLAKIGVLQPEQVDELTELGVEMVKTQGTVQTT